MELREKDTRKVVAALKCCANDLADCADCYLFGEDRCRKVLVSDAMEHIEELEKEVEYFAEHRGYEWISVKDRLPKSEFVLCTDGKYCFMNIIPDMEDVLEVCATHWMPLPEPPKPKVPTFKDVFLEKFPKAATRNDGSLKSCAKVIFPYMKAGRCSFVDACVECWNQPYYEEEGGEE